MQTFLPYRSFLRSASVLDNKRLGKQRIEAKQIYFALTRSDYGWQHHPAVKMWRGHETALLEYGLSVCIVWRSRGFKDQQHDFFQTHYRTRRYREKWSTPVSYPSWLANPKFHRAHRSNLVRKDPAHYRRFFPKVPDNLPYIWP